MKELYPVYYCSRNDVADFLVGLYETKEAAQAAAYDETVAMIEKGISGGIFLTKDNKSFPLNTIKNCWIYECAINPILSKDGERIPWIVGETETYCVKRMIYNVYEEVHVSYMQTTNSTDEIPVAAIGVSKVSFEEAEAAAEKVIADWIAEEPIRQERQRKFQEDCKRIELMANCLTDEAVGFRLNEMLEEPVSEETIEFMKKANEILQTKPDSENG